MSHSTTLDGVSQTCPRDRPDHPLVEEARASCAGWRREWTEAADREVSRVAAWCPVWIEGVRCWCHLHARPRIEVVRTLRVWVFESITTRRHGLAIRHEDKRSSQGGESLLTYHHFTIIRHTPRKGTNNHKSARRDAIRIVLIIHERLISKGKGKVERYNGKKREVYQECPKFPNLIIIP